MQVPAAQSQMDKINLLMLQGSGGAGSSGLLLTLAPWLLIFGIFYLLIIRPQQKRQRQAQTDREQMLTSLKPGDKVVTSGGILGTIVSVRDSTVRLNVAQSVSIEVQRSAIGSLQAAEVKEAESSK